MAASFAGRFAPAGLLEEISRAARSAPQAHLTTRPTELLLTAFSTLVSEGRTAAAPALSRSADMFAYGEIAPAEGLRWGWLAAAAAIMLWDHARWWAVIDRQLHSVREAGLLNQLPVYLTSLALVTTVRGEFATADLLIAEADALADTTGTQHLNGAVVLAAFRGQEAELSRLTDIQLTNPLMARHGLGLQFCQWAAAMLSNSLGRYERAVAEARKASDQAPELFVSGWALVELIEAAARAGQTHLARDALGRLVDATGIGESDWGLGVLARSRALLSEGEAAEGCYREAIERLSASQILPEVARAHLVYGEWLRHENRRHEARAQLRQADQQFTQIGMLAFADRARRERLATGETVREFGVKTGEDLSTQERQIAQLARQGLSNAEIGDRLILSPRTVEWHLRKVFIKLHIRTRRELRDVLR